MICAVLKIKIFVYFVTSGLSLILNFISTTGDNDKQMDTDALDLQEIKRGGQSFYVFFNISN